MFGRRGVKVCTVARTCVRLGIAAIACFLCGCVEAADVHTTQGPLQGDLGGEVAVRSEYVKVTEGSKQYEVAYYAVLEGAAIQELYSDRVVLGKEAVHVLLCSWAVAEKRPNDEEALAAKYLETQPGWPVAMGFLDSGAAVARMRIEPKVGGTDLAELFGTVKSMMGGSNPAFLATPKQTILLGTVTFTVDQVGRHKAALRSDLELSASGKKTTVPLATLAPGAGTNE